MNQIALRIRTRNLYNLSETSNENEIALDIVVKNEKSESLVYKARTYIFKQNPNERKKILVKGLQKCFFQRKNYVKHASKGKLLETPIEIHHMLSFPRLPVTTW